MKKLIAIAFILMFSTTTVTAFAAGGKNRGELGNGQTTQDLCGPNDDCAGDPYWWE